MTTSPFLTSSPILLRRSLGIGLANLRQRAGLHQREAAERLSVQRATIGHYESGRNLPSVGDLEALLRLYGAEDQIEHFRALRDGARRGENWWQKIAQIPSWFDHYLGLESGALVIDNFDTMYVPGLLQTERYAEAMFRADQTYSDDRVQQLVKLRTPSVQTAHLPARNGRRSRRGAPRVAWRRALLRRGRRDRAVPAGDVRPSPSGCRPERLQSTGRASDEGDQSMITKDALRGPVNWRKSSRSKQQGDCVEVGFAPDAVGVRDSKDRAGGVLAFGPGQWDAFTAALRAGKYDR